MIHKSICNYVKRHGSIDDKYFNEQTVGEIIRGFSDWKMVTLQGRFNYKKTHGQPEATALTHNDGSVRESIAQGRIGVKIEEGIPMEKYLYDTKAYDSSLELKNINTSIDEVIVYGKIPRNSIAIPTITGESYSPDFMYIVKKTMEKKSSILLWRLRELKINQLFAALRRQKSNVPRCSSKTYHHKGIMCISKHNSTTRKCCKL